MSLKNIELSMTFLFTIISEVLYYVLKLGQTLISNREKNADMNEAGSKKSQKSRKEIF